MNDTLKPNSKFNRFIAPEANRLDNIKPDTVSDPAQYELASMWRVVNWDLILS